MNAEKMFNELKEQFGDFLRENPDETKNSTGYVYEHLELHHMKAALYLHVNHEMNLNAHNLHDLILNYDHFKTLSDVPAEMETYDSTGINPGDFNPVHLVNYFKSSYL